MDRKYEHRDVARISLSSSVFRFKEGHQKKKKLLFFVVPPPRKLGGDSSPTDRNRGAGLGGVGWGGGWGGEVKKTCGTGAAQSGSRVN